MATFLRTIVKPSVLKLAQPKVVCSSIKGKRVAVKSSRTDLITRGLSLLENVEINHEQAAKAMAGATFMWMASADNAFASQELAQLAEGDNRVFTLLVILVPALGWVLFNILQPALNQLNKMRGAKSVVGALGLGAAGSLLLAESADAAQEIAQLADDTRPLLLLFILVPALGWVLFNILQPALNQLNKMRGLKSTIGALGLSTASTLLLSENADALQEIATVAEDNRPLLLLFILVPALGWVLFNILQPALNQLNKMRGLKSIVGAAGLGASGTLFLSENAEAAEEFAQLSADNRPLLLLLILVPALGWVLFNILQPALRQIDNQIQKNKKK